MSRLLLLLALPAVLLVAACGENVPGNAVARVGDDLIEKREFDRWVQIAAASQQAMAAPTGGRPPQVQVPQPPDFAQCVAQKKRTAPRPAQGQPQPQDSDLREQCKQEYEQLRDAALQFLIQEQWVEGEAAERDVRLTDQEFDRYFAQQKRESFPQEADYRRFLRSSGYTEEEIKRQLRFRLLTEKLSAKVVEGKDRVSDQQVRAYFERNRRQFSQPERRDLRVVVARTQERAEQAKEALEDGASFRQVARRFSIDPTTKDTGGVLTGVPEGQGQLEPSLERAVFSAEKGELTGPVRTANGFYVFQVQKVTPPSQQDVRAATPSIRSILAQENQQKALRTFVEDFQEQWREETVCQEGFLLPEQCGNAPEPPETTPGQAPPGAVPQQPGQPVPQQPGQPVPGQPAPAPPAQPGAPGAPVPPSQQP